MGREPTRTTAWNAELYDGRHSFVWKLAGDVLALLDAQPGERIVDLGCGTGHLTAQIADRGAATVGVDASAEMIAKARATHPHLRFEVGDGREFDLGPGFDAVFSNAALHWMPTLPRVFARVRAHLRPGGRFVFEMGGKHNLDAIRAAVADAHRRLGVPESFSRHTNRYLSIAEACAELEPAALEVVHAQWVERPTPLEGEDGLRRWLEMFGGSWLAPLPAGSTQDFLRIVEEHARPHLHRAGGWIADYRRLRVRANAV